MSSCETKLTFCPSSVLWYASTSPLAHCPQSPHNPPTRSPSLKCQCDWTLLFFPCHLFLSDWMCFIYSCRGWERGRRREGWVGGDGRVQVAVMKGVFYTFTLAVFPVFSCLRRLIKWTWIVDVTLSVSPPPPPPLFFLVSPTHPSILFLPSSLSWFWPLSTCSHLYPSTHSLSHNAVSEHRQKATGKKTHLNCEHYKSRCWFLAYYALYTVGLLSVRHKNTAGEIFLNLYSKCLYREDSHRLTQARENLWIETSQSINIQETEIKHCVSSC